MKYKLWAIFACVLWGSAFVGAKIGFDYMPPMRLSGYRFALAGIMLWPFLMYQKVNIRHIKEHWRFMTFFAFLQSFLQYGIFFMGLNKVPAPTAAVIVGSGPLFVALMAHYAMKNDKMTIKKSVAILLGLAGVLFISFAKGDISGSGKDYYLGIMLLIISNTIGASTNIFVAKYNKSLSPILLTSFANFVGGLMLIIVSAFVEEANKLPITPEFIFVLVWLAIIPAAGFSIWYTLLKVPGMKVSELNMWKFIIPVTGCVLSWIILPDVLPDIESIVGIITISMALILLQISTGKTKD